MRNGVFFVVVWALWGAAAVAQPQRPQPPQRAQQLEHVQRLQLRSVVREQRAQPPRPPDLEQDESLPPRHLSAQERRALRQQLREQRDHEAPAPAPSQQ